MLDSSPVLIHHPPPQPPRRGIKRSASTASLLTPPHTVSDKKRARRELSPSESDAEDLFTEPVARVLFKPKDSSTALTTSDKVLEENPFWVAPEEETEGPRVKSLKRTTSLGSAPASPPPSRTNQVPPRLATPPPSTKSVRQAETPKTPVQTKRQELETPVEKSSEFPAHLDSPNNPFITHSGPGTPKGEPREVTPVLEEKPTVTYVFRGKKIEFTNPLYNLPDAAFEKSRLPVEHEEYSPPPVVKPQRLFKEEVKSVTRRRRAPKTTTPTTPTRTSARRAAKKANTPIKA